MLNAQCSMVRCKTKDERRVISRQYPVRSRQSNDQFSIHRSWSMLNEY